MFDFMLGVANATLFLGMLTLTIYSSRKLRLTEIKLNRLRRNVKENRIRLEKIEAGVENTLQEFNQFMQQANKEEQTKGSKTMFD